MWARHLEALRRRRPIEQVRKQCDDDDDGWGDDGAKKTRWTLECDIDSRKGTEKMQLWKMWAEGCLDLERGVRVD